jgi:hypothetical protein
VLQDVHDVGSLRHRVEPEYDEAAVLWRGDQGDGCLGDDGQRAFASDEEPGDVEAVLRQQRLQGIAGHPPHEGAELGADGGEVGAHQLLQLAQEPAAGTVMGGAPGLQVERAT